MTTFNLANRFYGNLQTMTNEGTIRTYNNTKSDLISMLQDVNETVRNRELREELEDACKALDETFREPFDPED